MDRKHPVQRTNTVNSKQTFPEKELSGNIPNFHIHASVRDLYIFVLYIYFLNRSAYSVARNMWTDPGNKQHKTLTYTCVKIGTEAAQLPKKEHINGIFVAVSVLEQE